MSNYENDIYTELDATTVAKGCSLEKDSSAKPKAGMAASNKLALLLLCVITLIVLLVAVVACIAFAIEISKLKTETASLQIASSPSQQPQNVLVTFENLTQQLQDKIQQLDGFLSSQSSDSALNDQFHMQLNDLSRGYSALDDKIQELNTSIDMITSSSALDDRIQELNTSIDMIAITSSSALDDRIQELNTSIDMITDRIQELSTSIDVITSSLGSGLHASVPALSCAALPPSTPSGYYWVRSIIGSAVRVYCDMTRSCGGVIGGWRRVAELDMANSSHQCPSGLRQRIDSNIRTCSINSQTSGCSSAFFYSTRLEYSKVCGKITAYQVGSPDTFANVQSQTLNGYYVDGISLTHGNPREHIWTFAAGLDEVGTYPSLNCPCININQAELATQPPAYVGSDYFCDTASHERYVDGRFYANDPLWDGAGCGPLNTCCSLNNPPWFYKQLPRTTTDNIEMRLCRDQGSIDEDIAVSMVEIYIQ